MPEFSQASKRYDPYQNFKFRIKDGKNYVAGVSKVGMLKRTTEVVKHRVGGDPSSSRKQTTKRGSSPSSTRSSGAGSPSSRRCPTSTRTPT